MLPSCWWGAHPMRARIREFAQATSLHTAQDALAAGRANVSPKKVLTTLNSFWKFVRTPVSVALLYLLASCLPQVTVAKHDGGVQSLAQFEAWTTEAGGKLPSCVSRTDSIKIVFRTRAGEVLFNVPAKLFRGALTESREADYEKLCSGLPLLARRLYLQIATQRARGLPALVDGAFLPSTIIIHGHTSPVSRPKVMSDFLDSWISEGGITQNVDDLFERGGPNLATIYRSVTGWKTPSREPMTFTCDPTANFCIVEYNSNFDLLLTYHPYIAIGSASRDTGLNFSNIRQVDENTNRLIASLILKDSRGRTPSTAE